MKAVQGRDKIHIKSNQLDRGKRTQSKQFNTRGHLKYNKTTMVPPLFSSKSVVSKKLVSTHTSSSQGLLGALFQWTLLLWFPGTSFTSSSQLVVTISALLLIKPVDTLNPPPTGKCPTSFSHSENIVCWMRTQGILGTLFPHFHIRVFPYPQICKSGTHILSYNCSEFLLTSPKLIRCCFTLAADTMSILMCREEENLVFWFGAQFNSTLNFTQSGWLILFSPDLHFRLAKRVSGQTHSLWLETATRTDVPLSDAF